MPTAGKFEKPKTHRAHILKSAKVQPDNDLELNSTSNAEMRSRVASLEKNYKPRFYCACAFLITAIVIIGALSIAFGIVVSSMNNNKGSNGETTTLAINIVSNASGATTTTTTTTAGTATSQ
ncbi:unnamed protein product [Rotaria magnacalcarata]